jgi:hypothetical protein
MNAKTVRIAKGAHDSPDSGACVMEVASMLAGERFSDRPRSVCPIVAAFLRDYNDRLGDRDRQELFPYAAMVVGSAAGRRVRLERARLLATWTTPRLSRRNAGIRARLIGPDVVAEAAARAAGLDPACRYAEVHALLVALLNVGHPLPEPVADGADLRVPA